MCISGSGITLATVQSWKNVKFDHCGDQYVKFKLEAKVPRVSTSSCTTVLQCMNVVYLLMNKQDRGMEQQGDGRWGREEELGRNSN